jgi:uncharacterized protein with PIN domain
MTHRRSEYRFVADAMLGRLARWLRFLGYDTAYEADIADATLVRRALQEARFLLTRDRRLLERWRLPDALLVEGDVPLRQLRQIVEALHLSWKEREANRCTVCNGELLPAAPEEIAGRVPAYVHRTQRTFAVCPGCRRVYWHGTHAERMQDDLRRALSPIR